MPLPSGLGFRIHKKISVLFVRLNEVEAPQETHAKFILHVELLAEILVPRDDRANEIARRSNRFKQINTDFLNLIREFVAKNLKPETETIKQIND